MSYRDIVVEARDRVGLIRLNRPQRMNALSDALAAELATALAWFDADANIGAIVITGNEKAFAAGADIGNMAEWDYQKVYADNYIMSWESVKHTRKPVIAAVAGYALGGGCELAMMCDMIIAADTAKFGQPEITVGTMPGLGGTQRLPRAVGKAKAMDWCLTGRSRAKRARRARRSRRQASRRSARGRGEDRELFAARRAQGQGSDQPRLRVIARGRAPLRAARIPLDLRARGSEGRHARLRREAQARLQESLTAI